ncbi:hypothetical protein SteCoe_21713 [Stentor coeruleus]|uniref:Uncharacterized protein n=1 Tax=Stentor coeruleus TaxID=5963 RepID=A0A1R2BNW6_9CILI|nr:hypothetical protein SteCoe_21713 [Stentor coeruleus]
MGGKHSHGSIVIQLESQYSRGNEEITGIIHISLKKPMPPSTLYLVFKGKEETHWIESQTESWTDSDGNTQSRTVTDYYDGKHHICNYSQAIYIWNKGLYPGGYSIPFSFFIPSGLIGSFYYENLGTIGFIEYKMHGKLKSANGDKVTGKSPIQIILESHFVNTGLSVNKVALMKTWCCAKKGACRINAAFPQDSYNPSQIATVIVEVDNTLSLLNVKSISCKLIYSIRLICSTGRANFSKKCIIEEYVPRYIEAGQSLINNSAIEIKLNLLQHSDLLQRMYTTRSHLIECIYTLVIEASMEGSCICCGDKPCVESAMNIVPNVIQIQPSVPDAPQNWNPQVYQSAHVKYDSVYEPTEVSSNYV